MTSFIDFEFAFTEVKEKCEWEGVGGTSRAAIHIGEGKGVRCIGG